MKITSVQETAQTLPGLQALGAQLRAQRKGLGVSATVAAEAAGLSRVTLHRIEKGEPTVAMGAWYKVAAALGLALQAQGGQSKVGAPIVQGWWSVRIPLADYPQLKALAWHVHAGEELTPVEAHDIYERNDRHLDVGAMTPAERDLWQALRAAFGRSAEHV